MARKMISKTRYMYGRQCLKLLWLSVHDQSKLAPPDAATQRIFDQGSQVGELARTLLPEGILISSEDFRANLKLTRELLRQRKPLFEAGFLCDDLYSRVDILRPAEGEAWDIIEVKSITSPKEENYHDLSFQKLCCQKAGLEVRRCCLAYINNQYVRRGAIDPAGLFKIEDVSEQVTQASRGISDRVAQMFAVLAAEECPEELVGSRCSDPYACAVSACWEELPANNILSLIRGGERRFDLFNRGVLYLRDIPPGDKLSRAQQIQVTCDVERRPHVDRQAIAEFLATIDLPTRFLDFETFATAIPLFEGTRPYQRIPFQYSLHLIQGSQISQRSFLAEGEDDPRPALLRQLRTDLGKSGSVLAYNLSFEESLLRELARDFPDEGSWIEKVIPRMRDLYQPFRNFDYYHPAQSGSASIKAVLPALTGRSYAALNIHGGEEASSAYLEMTYGGLGAEERAKVRSDLLRYCGLDTEGMVELLDRLKRLGEGGEV